MEIGLVLKSEKFSNALKGVYFSWFVMILENYLMDEVLFMKKLSG